MNNHNTQGINDLWQTYVDIYRLLSNAKGEIYAKTSPLERIELVRQALDPFQGGLSAALNFAESMGIEERKELLSDFISLASSFHGYTQAAQELVLSLPQKWLIENIAPMIDNLLSSAQATEEEYGFMLTLCNQIDDSLTQKFAQKASQHPDPYIQAEGKKWLKIDS
jgi:hypothetical protein